MRILIHSNGPNVPTGYGVQTALLAPRLRDAGHEVAISVYYGHQSGLGEWNGITLLPGDVTESYGNAILHEHAARWFGGDPLGGWIIPIMDVFGLTNPTFNQFNIAAWTPVDHHPAPPAVIDFFKRTDAVPIAMSRFGEDQLRRAGRDPMYAPLVVDTNVFSPVDDAKKVCGLEGDRFVVMMNGMNKGAYHHRKGFPEAFFAFAQFAKNHDDALLYMHTEMYGAHAQGINLVDLAMARGISEHQIKFCDQYAYRCGFIPTEQLAAVYSAADVLLAPSRGEGFCIPLIEAQACGTPVIVTDFSAQPELVGAGWKVPGQPEWEAALASDYIKADIPSLIDALELAYEERGSEVNRVAAINKAREYDADFCFAKYWQPILDELQGGTPVELVREKIPAINGVAVVVPVLDRPQNVAPLVRSFKAASGKGVANLYFVVDDGDELQIQAIKEAGANILPATRGSTFAQKVNAAFEQTTEPWLFVTGDDVKFHRGWIDAARQLSDRFDVIGTNDSVDPKRGNAKVQSGSHADHFFIRRSYVDEYGGSLTGLVCHEGYRHFYTDVEVVELAKARRVWSPCLDSLVEHLHPDVNKEVPVDDTYQLGWSFREQDEREWLKRRPLVEMQREGLGKVRAA
jgi:glycosyltransferase involved in cell wall biosynthesis